MNLLILLSTADKTMISMHFREPSLVSYTRSSGECDRYRLMRKGAVTIPVTAILSAKDDGDKIRGRLGNSFYKYEYLTKRKLALTNVFATERATVDSAFWRE